MATFVTKHLRIAGGVAEVEQRLRPTGWFSESTAWVGRLTPLRRFVRTETVGAALLIAAVLAALVWANVGSSYLARCRRRDSNPRHADYDSAVLWLYSAV
jgi:hypothetical protein